MKMDKEFPERLRNVSENYFLNFYFLNVDISLIIHDPNLNCSYALITLLLMELCLSFLI